LIVVRIQLVNISSRPPKKREEVAAGLLDIVADKGPFSSIEAARSLLETEKGVKASKSLVGTVLKHSPCFKPVKPKILPLNNTPHQVHLEFSMFLD